MSTRWPPDPATAQASTPGQFSGPAALPDPDGQGVWSAVFNAQGTLATGDYAGDIFLWDTATGNSAGPLAMPGGGYNPVTALAFTADGSLLASADNDGTTYLWNVATMRGKPIYTAATVWSLAFSHDGTLAMAASDGHAYLWRVTATSLTAIMTRTLTDPGSGTYGVDTVAFSSDNVIATATRQRSPGVIDAEPTAGAVTAVLG